MKCSQLGIDLFRIALHQNFFSLPIACSLERKTQPIFDSTKWPKMMKRISYLLLLTAWIGFATGCETKTSKQAGISSPSKTDHGHDDHDDHDHADDHSGHHHDEGANGGHMEHFDTNKSVHFEWTHDDKEGTLGFYFEEIVAQGAKVESVKVDVVLDGETRSFPVPADESAKIKGTAFKVKNGELLTLVEASGKDAKGPQAKLIIVIDGKTESALLVDEHEHHHH